MALISDAVLDEVERSISRFDIDELATGDTVAVVLSDEGETANWVATLSREGKSFTLVVVVTDLATGTRFESASVSVSGTKLGSLIGKFKSSLSGAKKAE